MFWAVGALSLMTRQTVRVCRLVPNGVLGEQTNWEKETHMRDFIMWMSEIISRYDLADRDTPFYIGG